MDLKFCTKCRIVEHNVEDYPIVLEKLSNKNNINVLSGVPKHELLNHKKMQIVTRHGIRIGDDNPQITKIQNKNDNYPNPHKKNIYLIMLQKYLKSYHIRKKMKNVRSKPLTNSYKSL